MIRARATDEQGRPVIILGITPENFARMRAGEPIRVTGESVGLPDFGSVFIAFGTVTELTRALLGGVGPDTQIRIEAALRDDGSPR